MKGSFTTMVVVSPVHDIHLVTLGSFFDDDFVRLDTLQGHHFEYLISLNGGQIREHEIIAQHFRNALYICWGLKNKVVIKNAW